VIDDESRSLCFAQHVEEIARIGIFVTILTGALLILAFITSRVLRASRAQTSALMLSICFINAANYGVPQHRKRVLAIGGLGWEPRVPGRRTLLSVRRGRDEPLLTSR